MVHGGGCGGGCSASVLSELSLFISTGWTQNRHGGVMARGDTAFADALLVSLALMVMFCESM